MTQSNDSIKRMLTWVDRGMVFYLQAVTKDSIYNTLVAKVYHQGGEICVSIKHIPPEISPRTVELEIEEAKRMLAQKIADRVNHQLTYALDQGEI